MARKILEKAEEEEEEEEEAATTTEAAAEANGDRRRRRRCSPPPPLVIEIDVSACEVLSKNCMGGQDPPGGADPGLWAWGGREGGDGDDIPLERRLLSAAAAAGLPPALTSLALPARPFSLYPETKEEAGTRYLVSLAGAAARALAAAAAAAAGEAEEENKKSEDPKKKTKKKRPPPPTTMVVTHGEAVSAATRMTASFTSSRGKPYAVPPTGVVVLDVLIDDDDDEGEQEERDDGCDGDGSKSCALLSAAASAVACARWELSQAARGVAFE